MEYHTKLNKERFDLIFIFCKLDKDNYGYLFWLKNNIYYIYD